MPSKNHKKPPKWFNPSSYDVANSFSLKEWFNQLFLRFMLLEQLGDGDKSKQEEVIKAFIKVKHETFPDVPEVPLSYLHVLQIPMNLENVNDKKLVQKFVWSTTTSEITLNFAKLTKNTFALDEINHYQNIKNPILSGSLLNPVVNKGKVRLIDELPPSNFFGRRTLTVDLTAKEPDIRRDFEIWLQAAKQNHDSDENVQHVSDDKMEKWAKTRVIAYLDLMIWKKSEQKRASKEQLMDWVDENGDYKHSFSSESYRRKAYGSLFKELMNWTFFNRLFKTAYDTNNEQDLLSLFKALMNKHNISVDDLRPIEKNRNEASIIGELLLKQ